MVGMVDSFSGRDRRPPPVTRQDDLPEIEIPLPPGAAKGKLPPRPQRRTELTRDEGVRSTHALLLPRRRRRLRGKVLLFSVIGFGLGILVGIAFLLG